mgnify:FL=1|tara:strand:+ start:155 stop:382 length:228 start_codon:yes stop_codon:yes gene_type:complete
METKVEKTIIERIKEERSNFFEANNKMPEVIIVDPYVGAAIREHLGMGDLEDLEKFEGMEIAYSIDKNGEPYRLL